MQGFREIFADRLRERGLRATPERMDVLAEAFRQIGHFHASDLYEALRRRGHKTSRATVYRTMGHLVETGLLRKYDMGIGQALYEPELGRTHHEHMVCVECGRIFEFVQNQIEKLQDEVCRAQRFRPLTHSLQIHGICADCQHGPGAAASEPKRLGAGS